MTTKAQYAGDAQQAAAADGPFGWYRRASASARRAFWSCKIGYALDAMDTMFLAFVIPAIMATWGISRADAGLVGTVTLLSSALGGWVAGILSDRIGRVKTLQVTIVWFSVFTFLCALAQSYDQLLWARGLMGLGFGGEWTAGAVLIGEAIAAGDRGKAVGTVQAGWALGWGISALLYTVVFSLLPGELAWRALFAIGLLPALFVIPLRRMVQEPEVHARQKAREASSGEHSSFLQIFSKYGSTTLRAAILTTGAQGGYYAITIWMPTWLKTSQHLSVVGTGGYLSVIIVGSYIGYLTSAALNDRIGRRLTLIGYAMASMAIAFVYTRMPMSNGLLLALGFPLGFCASGIFAGMGAYLTELFPTRVRGSGAGFCYNFGRAVGATFPFFIGVVSKTMTLGAAISVFAASAYGLVMLAALILPETRGAQLED